MFEVFCPEIESAELISESSLGLGRDLEDGAMETQLSDGRCV